MRNLCAFVCGRVYACMDLLRFALLLKFLSPVFCEHRSPPGQQLRIGLQQGAGGV